ncbi:MAG: hypothetical protein EAY81_05425 [Bacteroidetes bacterium]|nr:MAG: hypothetical protein EAY81_05425 [Bacteroidota bacterium]
MLTWRFNAYETELINFVGQSMRQYILISWCILCFQPILVKGQETLVNRFDVKDGLTSSCVYKVFEDKQGYLWFLTFKGVNRYDGKDVTYFSQKDGFTGAGSYRVIEDKIGALWFVSTDFKLFRFFNNRFEEILENSLICWIEEDTEGNILAITRQGESGTLLFKINQKTLQSSVQVKTTDAPFGLLNLTKDELLISSYRGVIRFKGNSAVDTLIYRKNDKHIAIRMFRLGGTIYVTNETGIYMYEPNKRQLILVYRFENMEIYDMAYDSWDSAYLVGTSNGMLWFKNNIALNSKPKIYLHKKPILGISIHREGNVWAGTLDDGAFRINTNSEYLTTGDERVVSVNKESDDIYLTTRLNTIYRIEKGRLIPMRLCDKNDSHAMINNAISLNDTAIIITRRGREERFYIKSRRIYQSQSIYQASKYLDLSYSKVKGLVYSAGGNGIYYLANNQKKWIISYDELPKLYNYLKKIGVKLAPSVPLGVFEEKVYLKTNKGILVIHSKRPNKYSFIKLDCDAVEMIAYKGTMIISSTNNGIYLLNKNVIKNITSTDGLLSNNCSSITLKGNHLWVCTNKGISTIDMVEQRIARNYTNKDYLMSNEVNNVLFHNGYVYASALNGVSIFKERTTTFNVLPKIILEGVEVNNKRMNWLGDTTLPYTQNSITILCKSPGYRSANHNTYRYVVGYGSRLDTILNTTGILQLSSLSPGKYQITLDVKNIDGIWSQQPQLIRFNILPPFWKSSLFFVVVGLLAFVVLSLIIYIYISNYKKQQAYRYRLAQSELKALRLYMNPHFIFNSLTSLQAFVLTGKMQDANIFIGKFSRLIRAVMNHSITGEITIREEVLLLTNYLNLEKIRFKAGLDFVIEIDQQIDSNYVKIPALIIQPIVENAVKHGLEGRMNMPGRVEVCFKLKDKQILCVVTDNGNGVNSNKKADFEHVSSGIKFTRERIGLIGKIDNEEPIVITNLYDGDKVCGTKVEITIPILND